MIKSVFKNIRFYGVIMIKNRAATRAMIKSQRLERLYKGFSGLKIITCLLKSTHGDPFLVQRVIGKVVEKGSYSRK